MKGSMILLYGRLQGILSIEKLLQAVSHHISGLNKVLTKLQATGEKFDSIVLKVSSAIGKHTLGRELSEAENAKLMFFLHKVVIFCLVAGYMIGYLMAR